MATTIGDAVEAVRPHVVRIITPSGSGTGHLFYRGTFVGVATAAHVIEKAHYFEEPIDLFSTVNGTSTRTMASARAVSVSRQQDVAYIACAEGSLELPTAALPLTVEGGELQIGTPIGWLGYPGGAGLANTLCYFGGSVSAFVPSEAAYLVDGVVIHGVSGGPAFWVDPDDGNQTLVGVASGVVFTVLVRIPARHLRMAPSARRTGGCGSSAPS